MTRRAGRDPARGVHPRSEVGESALGELDLALRKLPGVLLEEVQQDVQVLRALVEQPEVRVGEAHAQFAQLAVDLGGDRVADANRSTSTAAAGLDRAVQEESAA